MARSDRYLGIYVRDHHAAAGGGIALAHRIRRENAGSPLEETLATVIPAIERDRLVLEDVADALGARLSATKDVGARMAELVSRLKPNGKARGYSPVSRLLELEALLSGIDAKRSLWRALSAARRLELETFDFDTLVAGATWQREQLVPHHERAAAVAFDELFDARLRQVVPA
jgi:hypothetical protein